MAFFKRVPSDGQKGKVSYNSGIVSGIVQLARRGSGGRGSSRQ